MMEIFTFLTLSQTIFYMECISIEPSFIRKRWDTVLGEPNERGLPQAIRADKHRQR